MLPTPAAAFLIADIDADFGVMMSASHNPAPDNGIKIFARGGVKLPDVVEQRIEQAMAGEKLQPTGAGVGRIRRFADAEDRYVVHLLGVAAATGSTASTSCSTARMARHPASLPRRSATPARA